jgi:hypothetical protein
MQAIHLLKVSFLILKTPLLYWNKINLKMYRHTSAQRYIVSSSKANQKTKLLGFSTTPSRTCILDMEAQFIHWTSMHYFKIMFSGTIRRQNKAGVYILVALNLMEKVNIFVKNSYTIDCSFILKHNTFENNIA